MSLEKVKLYFRHNKKKAVLIGGGILIVLIIIGAIIINQTYFNAETEAGTKNGQVEFELEKGKLSEGAKKVKDKTASSDEYVQFGNGNGSVTTPSPTATATNIPTQTTTPTTTATSTPKPTVTKTPSPTQTTTPTSAPTQQPTVTSTPITGATYPSQILSLTNWKLTLPIGPTTDATEITNLNNYQIDPWFIVQDGGVRFRAHTSGSRTSTNTQYARSELRERTNNGSENANWNSSTGKHTMTIDQKITHLPDGKKHVVVGQIHDQNDDVIVIRLEGSKLFIDINGNDGPTLNSNYVLGTRFTVTFQVQNNQTKIYYNGSSTPAYTLNQSYSDAFFKAGMYVQSNCTTESEYGKVCGTNNYGESIIYSVNVIHE